MIETTANRIAGWIDRNTTSKSFPISKEVLTYALKIYMNGFAIVVVTLLIGLFAGKPIESVIALLSFSLLRAFSGGFHFKTMSGCFLISVGIFGTVLFIPSPDVWIQYILLSVSILLAIGFAPNASFDPIAGNRLFPYMKWISVGMIASNFFVASWVITLCFFIQCLSLIPYRRR
ncbi:accessory gene regulator B family protein [Paenibacillus sp.]|uniref:accessory gene regulator ArgB-like protein n=1 Tax=Paenibacillus sp. TaxID=58172 RepID=UPI002811388E|nr:accessory gene regulator B family protein [Paenibacillus sp.]